MCEVDYTCISVQCKNLRIIIFWMKMTCRYLIYFLIESHSAIAPLTIMCGFYHQPLMMALEYTAALMPFQFKSNLSCCSTVVAITGGWVGLYCTAWCCPHFLLLFLHLVSCCGLLYGRMDKPLNGDLQMTNDGAV